MAPILYMVPGSPAVRAVQILAKAIGVELEEKLVDITKGENLTPEYLKLNPQHTVPTLIDDNGFSFWESHAITTYLVSKYFEDDALYPKDLAKRAIIDQRLHFDTGVVFVAVSKITFAVLRKEKTTVNESDCEEINQIYAFLEAFLDGKEWMAGDELSLADYHLYTTVTCLNVFNELDEEKYPLVAAWLNKVNDLPEVEVSKEGLAMYKSMMKSVLS